MITSAAKQTLVPSAACFNIGYRDQWLRVHSRRVSSQGGTSRVLVCMYPVWSAMRSSTDDSVLRIEQREEALDCDEIASVHYSCPGAASRQFLCAGGHAALCAEC